MNSYLNTFTKNHSSSFTQDIEVIYKIPAETKGFLEVEEK
jgi:hypothetical protein